MTSHFCLEFRNSLPVPVVHAVASMSSDLISRDLAAHVLAASTVMVHMPYLKNLGDFFSAIPAFFNAFNGACGSASQTPANSVTQNAYRSAALAPIEPASRAEHNDMRKHGVERTC